jgi:hypothetical protein
MRRLRDATPSRSTDCWTNANSVANRTISNRAVDSVGCDDTPSAITSEPDCSSGKFLDGYIDVGAVVNTVVIEKTTILAGTTFPLVVLTEFRLDDRKIQTESWSPSTAGTAAFFPYTTLNNLLYGHVLPHKEGKGDHVQRVVTRIVKSVVVELADR